MACNPSILRQVPLFALLDDDETAVLAGSLGLLPQAARAQQAESQLEETRALERLALGQAVYEVEKAYADAVEAEGTATGPGRSREKAGVTPVNASNPAGCTRSVSRPGESGCVAASDSDSSIRVSTSTGGCASNLAAGSPSRGPSSPRSP